MTKYRFARHCWKPRYCRTPSEVCDTLALFGAFDKAVKAVHTIGIALNMEEEDHV